MTTPAAEALYRAQHNAAMEGKRYAVFNPHNKPLDDLPVIYAFPNSTEPGWIPAYAMAEDGTCLGSHICNHEDYILHDLGVLEGTRKDRHEKDYQRHYPDGYRMEFVPTSQVKKHAGLEKAWALNQEKGKQAKAEESCS